MATEPNKKVEEALHAYARQRREDAGAPIELHPATRRILQGEVAKLKAAQPPERRPRWHSVLLLWPRFAAAVGMLAVLATGVWVFTQGESRKLNETAQLASYRPDADESEFRDAKKDVAELKAEADRLSTAAPTTDDFSKQWAAERRPEIMFNDPAKSQLRDTETAAAATRPEVRREKQITLQYDAPPQQPVNLGLPLLVQSGTDKSADLGLLNESLEQKRFYQVKNGQFAEHRFDPSATITSAVTISPPIDTYYFGVADTNSVALFGDFVRNEVTPSSSSSINPTDGVPVAALGDHFERQDANAPAILQKFRLEQHANGRISIRDADGSVYEGEILAAKTGADTGAKAKLAKDELQDSNRKLGEPHAAPVALAEPPTPISFRASGTNRNKELVVINGELFREHEQLSRERLLVGGKAATAPAPTESEVARRELRIQTGAANTRVLERGSRVNTSAPPTVIRARVQIGRTNQIELRAIRTR